MHTAGVTGRLLLYCRRMDAFARAVVTPLPNEVHPDLAAVSFSNSTDPAILDSSLPGSPQGRFSIMACDPMDVIRVDKDSAGCPFLAVYARVESYPAVLNNSPLPFVGGWIGFFSYEAGLRIEGVNPGPEDDVSCPLARFALYDAAAVFDYLEGRWYAVAVDWPAALADRRPSVGERIERVARLVSTAGPQFRESGFPRPTAPPAPNMSREAYYEKVRRAKRYIEAGDAYQVNLTQRFSASCDQSPWDLYRRLSCASPSTHAAFLEWDDFAVVSSSPELFLDLHDGRVITRPIKGTRRRGHDAASDRRLQEELVSCPKERAELTMITDLLRNDLGRVCRYGSVRVSNPGEIERHPTVFHRAATIEGELSPDRTWLDLLLATFPGGSITGAPKIRAMQIIGELEPTTRGVYCGSIGWIGLDGSLSLNIAIRTMIKSADVVHLYAGGAIVADSSPEAEYDEILAKAAGMMRALGHEIPALNTEASEVVRV